jgi:hypothetical protein
MTGIEGELVTILMVDGEELRYRTHDPDRLAHLVLRSRGYVFIRGNLIAVPRIEISSMGIIRGNHLVVVVSDTGTPLSPCIPSKAEQRKAT